LEVEMDEKGKKNIFARIFGAIWGWIKRHKVLSIILVLLIALILYIVNAVNKAKELLENNTFNYGTVEVKELSNSVSAKGKIVGLDKKEALGSITGVEFTAINVEVGDYVEAGQIIATLDSSDIEENIDIAKKQMNASNANSAIGVSGAERNLSNAEANRNRDAEKADINIARAWDSYIDAANKLVEVEKKYLQAVDARKAAENALNSANNAYNSTQSTIATVKSEFSTNLADLNTYITGLNVDTSTMADEDVASYETCMALVNQADISSFYSTTKTGSDFEVGDASTIDGYLNGMKTASTNYLAATSAPATDVTAASANLTAAQATEDTLKASWEAADASEDSLWNAYNDMIRAKEDTKRMDDATVASSVDNLQTTRNTASVSSLPAKQNIESMEEQIEKCTITAPMSGTVTAVNYKVGDKYDGIKPIIVVEDESAYQVSSEIDEYDISKIKLGQKVEIVTNGTGETKLEGVVSSIAPHATTALTATGAQSTAVTYNVLIDILTPNPDLKMDMTAKITVVTDQKDNCKCVPFDAIQEDEAGKFFVEIYNANVTVSEEGQIQYERVYIEKGLETDYYTEIISDELTEGTQVVIPSDYDASMYDISWEVG